jgi:general nucleoside transport system permease protein
VSTLAQPAVAPEKVAVVSWKTPIAFAVLTLIALVLFVVLRRDTDTTTFRLATSTDFIALPDLVMPTFATTLVAVALLAIGTAYSAWLVRRSQRPPLWLTIAFALVFVFAFLTWASAGPTGLPIPGLLIGTITVSVPLVFGAMSGVISERVGVVNIAIEGQLLAGAFSSAVIASATGSAFLGLLGAAVAGVLVSVVLAAFAIKYLVDQVIVGVVLNVLVVGLTSFFFTQVLSPNADTLNSPERLPLLPIPVLSQIPLIGPTLFNQRIVVYVMYVVVAVVYFALFHTRWGLRVRAVGEHPVAADTVGIKVNMTRFINVSVAGAIAGFGGAFFTLGLNGAFSKEMTAGAGYIALAAVIFGRWDPIRATLAALLFGFALNLQNQLGVIGSPVPSEFMLMLPYLVTIVAVAGLVGTVRGPAAAGKPYIKS